MEFDDQEFNAFEAQPAQNGDSGDVEEFLRKEQEMLGDSTNEFGFVTPAAAAADPFAAPEAADPFAAPAAEDPFAPVDNAVAAPVESDPFAAPADETFAQEQEQPAESFEAPSSEQQFYAAAPSPQSTPSSDPYASISQAQETPDVILEWRRKRDEMLEAKDKAAREKALAVQQEAKQALAEMQAEYEAKKKSLAQGNREAQKQFIESRDAAVKGGTWERVNSYVDVSQKGQKSQKDVSRMRSLLVQLKTMPTAPGA